jgi:predicted Zn-dependent peptidase
MPGCFLSCLVDGVVMALPVRICVLLRYYILCYGIANPIWYKRSRAGARSYKTYSIWQKDNWHMQEKTTLPNGVRVLTAPMPHVRSASVVLFFGVGSRYEAAEIAGISHFIEHMVFKGTAKYPTAQAISETIEGIGGSFNGGTSKELTVYSAKVSATHLPLALDVLIDMQRHPRFDPQEVEKERRVITEELNMYKDSPQDWVGVLIDEAMWPNLPLGRDEAGTKETVSRLKRTTMLDYLARYYVPNNLVVSVAGNVTHTQVVDEVQQLTDGWQCGVAPEWTPCLPPRDVPRVVLATKDTEQANLCLATPGVAHRDPDYYAMAVLNGLLADGMSSRLFQEIRERQGLAYDVSSYVANYHETGCLVIYAGVDPSQADATIRAIAAELGCVREELAPEAELERTKEYVKGRMILRLEETHNVASWLGGQEILRGEILELDTALALVDAVSAEDVRGVARRFFNDADLRLALVGPFDDRDHFEQLLHL